MEYREMNNIINAHIDGRRIKSTAKSGKFTHIISPHHIFNFEKNDYEIAPEKEVSFETKHELIEALLDGREFKINREDRSKLYYDEMSKGNPFRNGLFAMRTEFNQFNKLIEV